jgi:hypothetical protein
MRSQEEITVLRAAACARMCRQVADAAYAVLVRTAFAQLERIAGPDTKHGHRLRLENYALLAAELAPLAAKARLFWPLPRRLSMRALALARLAGGVLLCEVLLLRSVQAGS